MDISSERLNEIITGITYANSGDDREKQFGQLLSNFPNSEIFWRSFIVPMTNRIVPTVTDKLERIKYRSEVDIGLQELGSFHYSVFINMVYAYEVYKSKHLSFFENFYTHLGSVCDSVEEFLLRIYLLILRVTNSQSEIVQHLSKTKFLKLAGSWFDEHYSTIHRYYLSKGKKPPPVPLPSRGNLLDEYLNGYPPWKDYWRFAQLIKQYRNAIVHNYQIGFLQYSNGQHFVPKKEKIPSYKKWDDVFKGVQNPYKLKNDFVIREEQMESDIEEMQQKLQLLWQKPMDDLSELLFRQHNSILLRDFGLNLTPQ